MIKFKDLFKKSFSCLFLRDFLLLFFFFFSWYFIYLFIFYCFLFKIIFGVLPFELRGLLYQQFFHARIKFLSPSLLKGMSSLMKCKKKKIKKLKYTRYILPKCM